MEKKQRSLNYMCEHFFRDIQNSTVATTTTTTQHTREDNLLLHSSDERLDKQVEEKQATDFYCPVI